MVLGAGAGICYLSQDTRQPPIQGATRVTDPTMFQQQFRAAQTLHRQGRLRDAEAAYKALLAYVPARETVLRAMVQLYLDAGHAGPAINVLTALTDIAPGNPAYPDTLAGLYGETGQIAEAITTYRALLARHADLGNSWYNLARLEKRDGQFETALASYDRALAAGIEGPEEVHLNRGIIYADCLMRPVEAERELQAALAHNPAYVPALLNLANLQEERADRDAALATYEKILATAPGCHEALARYANLKGAHDTDDPLIGRLKQALDRSDVAPDDRTSLEFALGKLFNDTGHHDSAFGHYARANALSRAAGATYDRAAQERQTNSLIETFSSAWFQALEPVSDAAPVFLCGMFRSGSTLAEQVLGSHPLVTPGGELDFWVQTVARELSPFPDAVRSLDSAARRMLAERYTQMISRLYPDAGIVTDKRPDNFLYIGLIKSLFPKARIVHTRRDALDNCLSVFFLHLGHSMGYATDLLDAGHFYLEQERLMAHWKALFPDTIHTLDYDSLVADPRPEIERLLAFLGLQWEDRCLDFHTLGNVVKTASYWQVRKPLYKSASGRWRHYERQIAPLKAYLAKHRS
ncbi:MAG: sulfotransferase family protein [Alphaproteobacteria bacterium]|nr:MAG: sulfotransferase family protein [Alphaproteobacteria bacterium]